MGACAFGGGGCRLSLPRRAQIIGAWTPACQTPAYWVRDGRDRCIRRANFGCRYRQCGLPQGANAGNTIDGEYCNRLININFPRSVSARCATGRQSISLRSRQRWPPLGGHYRGAQYAAPAKFPGIVPRREQSFPGPSFFPWAARPRLRAGRNDIAWGLRLKHSL